jgi:predicted dehydrogenase
MSCDPVRIGFIGAGAICRLKHLPGLAPIDGAEVIAVCNRSRESSQAIAAEFDIPEIEDNWQALIARDDLDAVFIGTWPYMHKELSIAVLEAGKHCFCQARMCMDLAEAKQMLSAAQARPELVNMISPCPWDLEHYLRDLVQSGQLGEITSVELLAIGGGNLDRQSVHWRERVEHSGKQIMAMGIFAETLNALVGPYEQLTAHLSTPIAGKTDESGQQVRIGVPQVVIISGRLESGVLAVEHHTGLCADESSQGFTLTIRGLEGTVRYDMEDALELARPGEALQRVEVPQDQRTEWTVEEDFVGAVRAAREGKPPQERTVRPDFEEGVLYMRKVEAVHQAAATGQAVQPRKL